MEKRARILGKLILTVILSVLFIWLIHTDEKMIREQVSQPQGELVRAEDVWILSEELAALSENRIDKTALANYIEGRSLQEGEPEGSQEEKSQSYLTYGAYMELLELLTSAGRQDYISKDSEISTQKSPSIKDSLTYEDRYEDGHFLLKEDWYHSYEQLLAFYGLKDVIQAKEVALLCGNQSLAGQETIGEECLLSQDGRIYTCVSEEFADIMFTWVRAYVRENRLLTLVERLPREGVLSNIWVMEASEEDIQFFYEGYEILAQTDVASGDPTLYREQVGDLQFKEGGVSSLFVKRERIGGKLLGVSEAQVEIEGYGKLFLADDCVGYQLYEELRTVPLSEMSIGYDFTDFVLADGRICAFLLTRRESMETIRVAIKSEGFGNLYHDSLIFSSAEDMILTYGDYDDRKQEKIAAGQELCLKEGDRYLAGERAVLAPVAGSGRIRVLSHKRSQGTPEYRGVMEIQETEKGLVLINEVLLEEYLYSVVASEMPAHYPLEALKAQAVCARTYGYRYLKSPGYKSLGAHVDDSDNYQVYNNKTENVNSTKAVKETTGTLLFYGDEPVNTWYYSTSCGYGSDGGVWDESKKDEYPYLVSTYIGKARQEEGFAWEETSCSAEELSQEENFRDYISRTDENAYEKDETWFRWDYEVEKLDEALLSERLQERFQASPHKILTFTGKGDPEEAEGSFEEKMPEKFKKVYDIKCVKRKDGGVMDELLVITDQGSYKVISEYNIRYVLNQGGEAVGQNGTSRSASLLPSAYMIIDTVKSKGNVIGYTIRGGGYGHGAGMSQNGARAMGLEGMDYEKILSFYYRDCHPEKIY